MMGYSLVWVIAKGLWRFNQREGKSVALQFATYYYVADLALEKKLESV